MSPAEIESLIWGFLARKKKKTMNYVTFQCVVAILYLIYSKAIFKEVMYLIPILYEINEMDQIILIDMELQ